MPLSHVAGHRAPEYAPREAQTLGDDSHYHFALDTATSARRQEKGDTGTLGPAVVAAAVRVLAGVAGEDVKLVVRAAVEAMRERDWAMTRTAGSLLRSLARAHTLPDGLVQRQESGLSAGGQGEDGFSKMELRLLEEVLLCVRHADGNIRAAGVQALAALASGWGGGGGVAVVDGDLWRRVADKVAGQVAYVAAFRSEERRSGVRAAVVSGLLCLGGAWGGGGIAGGALQGIILGAYSETETVKAVGMVPVRPAAASIVSEGVAALAELSRRPVPGAREAAMRAAAAVLRASKDGGRPGGMKVEDELVLHRIALLQSLDLLACCHTQTPGTRAQPEPWVIGKGVGGMRRRVGLYARGPWRKSAAAASAKVSASAAVQRASLSFAEETRIDVMMHAQLPAALYPPGTAPVNAPLDTHTLSLSLTDETEGETSPSSAGGQMAKT